MGSKLEITVVIPSEIGLHHSVGTAHLVGPEVDAMYSGVDAVVQKKGLHVTCLPVHKEGGVGCSVLEQRVVCLYSGLGSR